MEGELSFSSSLPCGRCTDLIEWPLSERIRQEFRSAPTNFSREVDLSEDDLDHYYIENDSLDIFQLINDTIFLAIPDPLILRDAHNKCKLCKKDISNQQVAGDSEALRDNPFAVLGALKDKL